MSHSGWGCPCDSEKVKCWSHAGSVYTYIIWMICNNHLRADLTELSHPILSHAMSYVSTSPVSFREESSSGSLTDDSATTAPKLNNYKMFSELPFSFDGYLNYLQGEKIENKCFKRIFLFTLILPEPVFGPRCSRSSSECHVKWGPLPMRCSFLLLPTVFSLGLALSPYQRLQSKCSQNVHVFYICMVLFLYPLFFAQ